MTKISLSVFDMVFSIFKSLSFSYLPNVVLIYSVLLIYMHTQVATTGKIQKDTHTISYFRFSLSLACLVTINSVVLTYIHAQILTAAKMKTDTHIQLYKQFHKHSHTFSIIGLHPH